MTLSKPEFDFSKYVEVPESWIKNALDIPDSVSEQPEVKPFPRRYLTAASVVLIAVLGVSVYFLYGNKSPIPIVPKSSTPAAEAPSETTFVEAPSAESGTVPDQTEPTQSKEKPSAAPTQPATQIATDSRGNIIITNRTDSTAAPTTSLTQAATESATQKPQPIQAPTAKATETASVTPASEPVIPSSEPPTQISAPDIRKLTVIVPSDMFHVEICDSENEPLYCAVYDNSGRLLGDGDLYSDSHLIEKEPIPSMEGEAHGTSFLRYYEFEYDANQSPGSAFTYRIYLSDGHILYEGVVTV